ncbi:hypothetical protein NQ315_016899 [Exocentrus adspersus]|uniref:ditrans,polycis-polyprenyl diphosphate synthase [(2E,6E)-farnesyldiphosphate specific] n=1 Tax=Exocentrus adspersus TaxID=1586481 RepID=A0AAV8VYN7_9CUCU|nr:hypothetical protein NQ315_016899 [Exocentrus adspersus]
MWSACLFRALFFLAHSIYTVFEYIHGAVDSVINALVAVCHEVLSPTEKNKQLQRELEKVNKTPVHLTVLLGHEEPSLKDLANLVLWCLATRISFISFYDYKGTLKKKEEEFRYEVDKKKSKADHVIWHSSLHSTYKNGFIGKKIHVKVLTEEDSKNSVASLTREISLGKDREFGIESVSHSLRKQFEFPDPDLGLVCGKTFSLYSYPPWQVRVTEFFTVKSVRSITFSSFVEDLVRYSNCDQRLGK